MGENPYEAPVTKSESRQLRPWAGRVMTWIPLTLGINVVSFVFFSATICGCHFQSVAVPFGLAPVAWTTFAFSTYRTGGERLVAYFNGFFALAWLLLSWQSNLRFLL